VQRSGEMVDLAGAPATSDPLADAATPRRIERGAA
jgi:hypothetical protein